MIPIKDFENYSICEDGQVVNTTKNRVLKPSLNENGYLYVSLWKGNKSKSKTVHRLVAEAYIPNPLSKPVVNHKDANRANPHKDNLEWVTQSENVSHGYGLGTMSQKRKLTPDQLKECLFRFLAGETMTALSVDFSYSLGPLSVSLRNQAVRSNQERAFTAELIRQKNQRNKNANELKKQTISQFTVSGDLVAIHESQTAAARALGKRTSGPISNALTGKQQLAYGFKWKFA